MLYLAEVQRRPTGFGLGGGKTDLKLLACQRGEHNWVAVPGEEVIPADEAKEFSPGALVLVDLNNSKQVQQIQDAARQLVKILQNFSRSQEKSKTQWEEIEQWKASLTFQAQELNRREMELQAKEEQLEELQAQIDRLEQQRQEISQAQKASNLLREQIERNRAEVEATRVELQRRKEEFEQSKGEFSQGAVLAQEQSQYIQDLLNWLTQAVTPTNFMGKKLSQSLEIVSTQQKTLEHHRQQWEETSSSISTDGQEDVEGLVSHVQNQWLEWRQDQESLAESRLELKVQQTLLASKQEYSQVLNAQIGTQTQFYEQLINLVTVSEDNGITYKVDIEALEKMPLNDLEALVQSLQQDLQRDMSFVKDQEEELGLQRQEIDALQRRIDQATEYDRIGLQSELSDEQDRYRMLNESLVGSQRNLQERQDTLSQHQEVLWRRLGNSSAQKKSNSNIDMKPILSEIDTQRQKLTEQLQILETEIQQIQTEISQKQEIIDRQTQEQDAKRNEIENLELSLREKQATTGVGGAVVYQEVMQPIQDYLEQLKQQLEEVVGGVNQMQGISEQVAQLQQVFQSLIGQPE